MNASGSGKQEDSSCMETKIVLTSFPSIAGCIHVSTEVLAHGSSLPGAMVAFLKFAAASTAKDLKKAKIKLVVEDTFQQIF